MYIIDEVFIIIADVLFDSDFDNSKMSQIDLIDCQKQTTNKSSIINNIIPLSYRIITSSSLSIDTIIFHNNII